METFIITLLIVFLIFFIYMMYQLVRNATIFNIRGVWIKTRDNRWYTYSYQHMFAPKKSNWYGLKYPTDSDYKIQKDE